MVAPGSTGLVGSSGSRSGKLRLVHRSKFCPGEVDHAKQWVSKPYQVGLQVSCGVYLEVSAHAARSEEPVG